MRRRRMPRRMENQGDARRAEVGSRARGGKGTRGGVGIVGGIRVARRRAHPEGLSDDGDALAARADENGASVATTGEGCAFRASEGRAAERRAAGDGRARGRRRGGRREGHRRRGHRQRSRGVKWLGEGAEPLARHPPIEDDTHTRTAPERLRSRACRASLALTARSGFSRFFFCDWRRIRRSSDRDAPATISTSHDSSKSPDSGDSTDAGHSCDGCSDCRLAEQKASIAARAPPLFDAPGEQPCRQLNNSNHGEGE